MAYEPSKRRKGEELEMELDIRPVMNLMVVLIPLLIASAEFVKLNMIEVNLPPAKTSVGSEMDKEKLAKDKEQQKLLRLKLIITDEGIIIGNESGILRDESGEGPTIKKSPEGDYDYAKLREKLIELKKKITGKGFADENRVILSAEPQIQYQVIIKVMDNLQTYIDDENVIRPLFPEVNFSKVLL